MSGLRVARVGAILSAVALLAGLVGVAASPASADVAGSSADRAPMGCDGFTVSGDLGQDRFVKVVVPVNGTITASGTANFVGVAGKDTFANITADVIDGTAPQPIGNLPRFGTYSTDPNPRHPYTLGPWTTAGQFTSTQTVTIKVSDFAEGGFPFIPPVHVAYTLTIGVKAQNGDPAWCDIYAGTAYNDALLGDTWRSGGASDPVNTATGNVVDTATDIAAPPATFGMGWTRTYNGLDGYNVPDPITDQANVLGPEMTTPLDVHLRPLDDPNAAAKYGQTGGLEYRAADGMRVRIPATHTGDQTSTITFTAVPASLSASVSWNNHVFTMRMASGEIYTFNDTGQLSSRQDQAGQTVTVCRTGGRALNMRTGTDCATATPAYQLSFTDVTNDGLIDQVTSSIAGQATTTVDYQYLGGRLRAVSYPRQAGSAPTALVQPEAGTGTAGTSGNGGPALSAQVNAPGQMLYDKWGNLFFVDTNGHTVRELDTAGVISTVAGTGAACASPTSACGDGGVATAAALNRPTALAFDVGGNLFVGDSGNHKVRRIDRATRVISTVGGTGNSGVGLSAAQTTLQVPMSIAPDSAGNLYIADTYNMIIRKVDGAGNMTTVAGTGVTGNGSSIPSGVPASSANLNYPSAVAVDSTGNVFFSELNSLVVREVVLDPAAPAAQIGKIYTILGNGTNTLNNGASNAGVAANLTGSGYIYGVTVTGGGASEKVTVADYSYHQIRQLTLPSDVSTQFGVVRAIAGDPAGTGGFGGDGSAATSATARLQSPSGTAFDSAGNMYIADNGNQRIRMVSAAGVLTTIAGTGTAGYRNTTPSPEEDVPPLTAQLTNPRAVSVNAAGELLLADYGSQRVRKIANPGTPSARITTFSGGCTTTCSRDGVAPTSAAFGNVLSVASYDNGTTHMTYSSDDGNYVEGVSGATITIKGGNGANGFWASTRGTTATAAAIDTPAGLAFDKNGYLWVSDSTTHQLSVIDLQGHLTRLFTGQPCASSTAVCGDGTGTMAAAQLNAPKGLATDASGAVYVADAGDHRVRSVALQGGSTYVNPYATVITLAGTGTACATSTAACGDGAAGSAANLKSPSALVVDMFNSLYVADTGDNRIRRIAAPALPGVIGPGSIITTVAGSGTAGYQASDDYSVAPTATRLNAPLGVAVEDSGAVHVADTGNNRLRFAATTAGWRRYWMADWPATMTHREHTVGSGQPSMPDLVEMADAWGRVVSQDTASGEHTTFSYGPRVNGQNPPQTTTVAFCSKWNGASCDTIPETTVYNHDLSGRLLGMTDTNGKSTSQALIDDRLTSATDRAGASSGKAYDTWGRVIQVAKPDPVTGFVPQAGGATCPRLADGTFPDPSTCTGPNQAFTLERTEYCTAPAWLVNYDPRIKKQTDAAGNTTTFLYGASATIQNPCVSNTWNVNAYGAQPTPTAVVDPNNKITTIATTAGLLTSTVDPDGVTTTTTWDTTKRLKLSVKTGSNTTFYGYDPMGRQVVTHAPAGEETWNVYDTAGRVTDVIGPVASGSPGVTSCSQAATTCALPASVPGALDGPTVHTTYRLDGMLLSRTQGQTKAQAQTAAAGSRTWTYTDRYVNGTTTCMPPAAGCEHETTEQAPAHAYDPANPNLMTSTITTTHYNAAAQAVWTQTSDTAGATAAVKVTTSYADDAGTNLGLGRVGSTTTAAGTPSAVQRSNGYDGNLTASGNGATSGNGQITSTGVGQAAGRIVTGTKTYDKRGRVTDEQGPAVGDNLNVNVQSCTHYTYNNLDQVIQQDTGALTSNGCSDSSTTQVLRTRNYYDPTGRQLFTVVHQGSASTAMTDPTCPTGATPDRSDLITGTKYSDAGRATEVDEEPVNQTFDPANPTTTGFDWCAGAASVRKTTKVYDVGATGTGLLDHIIPPPGANAASTKYSYDPDGRVTETDQYTGATYSGSNPLSFTKHTYDAAGHTLTTSTPTPDGGTSDATTVTCYDGFGEMTYKSDPHAVNTAVAVCDPTSYLGADVAAGFGAYQSFDYYDNGALQNAWSPLRKTLGTDAKTTYFYDGHGNRTQRVSRTQDYSGAAPSTITETWTYFADDQLQSYTDPLNNTTNYTYYGNSEVPAAGQTTGGYPGKLKTISQPSGRTVTARYRSDGLLAQQDFTLTGQPTITTTFGYDARGNRLSMSDNSTGTTKTTTFSVDRVGRITQQVAPDGYDTNTHTYSWGYDTVGNVSRITYPDTSRYKIDHDDLNRLLTANIYLFTNWFVIDAYNRDPLGRTTLEHEVGGYGSGQSRSWTYATKAPQPTSFAELITDTPNVVVNTQLGYNIDGRLACETKASSGGCNQASGSATTNYHYDDAGQLLDATPLTGTANTYTYNMRGMRMSQSDASGTTYTGYNKNAQPCLQGPTAVSVSDCTMATAATATFAYDTDGRQTDYHYGRNNAAIDTDLGTAYDARGSIATITTPATNSHTSNIEYRRYNATGQLVRLSAGVDAAHQTGNDLVWDNTNATGVPQILEMRMNGTTYNRIPFGEYRISITQNGSNSAVFAYDAKKSTIKTTKTPAPESYDPYGNPGSAAGLTYYYFGYRGELTINGSVHLRARDYTPGAGSFTTRDPVGGDNGKATVADPYHYAWNDPVNRVDPRGLHAGPNGDPDYKAPTAPLTCASNPRPSPCAPIPTSRPCQGPLDCLRDPLQTIGHGEERPVACSELTVQMRSDNAIGRVYYRCLDSDVECSTNSFGPSEHLFTGRNERPLSIDLKIIRSEKFEDVPEWASSEGLTARDNAPGALADVLSNFSAASAIEIEASSYVAHYLCHQSSAWGWSGWHIASYREATDTRCRQWWNGAWAGIPAAPWSGDWDDCDAFHAGEG